MPLQFEEITGNIVFVKASGKLGDQDYREFVPRMEKLMEQWGRLRMVFEMTDEFQGWDLHSAWDELKFEFKHKDDIKRVGVIGDKRWESWAAQLSKFFTGANVRFFDHKQVEEAKAWIQELWYGSG